MWPAGRSGTRVSVPQPVALNFMRRPRARSEAPTRYIHPEWTGLGTVRENDTYDEQGRGRVGMYGSGDAAVVSRETKARGDTENDAVPQPRTGSSFESPAVGQAPPPVPPSGTGQTVELHLSAAPDVTPTGTVYGRGGVPVDDGR